MDTFKLFWITQPYTTNSEKVAFLNKRPVSKPFRSSGIFCNNCDRSLQPPFFFCSLSCKVHCLITSGCDISPSSAGIYCSQNFSDSDIHSPVSLSSSTSSDPSSISALPGSASLSTVGRFSSL